jgi:hypothetical protein
MPGAFCLVWAARKMSNDNNLDEAVDDNKPSRNKFSWRWKHLNRKQRRRYVGYRRDSEKELWFTPFFGRVFLCIQQLPLTKLLEYFTRKKEGEGKLRQSAVDKWVAYFLFAEIAIFFIVGAVKPNTFWAVAIVVLFGFRYLDIIQAWVEVFVTQTIDEKEKD